MHTLRPDTRDQPSAAPAAHSAAPHQCSPASNRWETLWVEPSQRPAGIALTLSKFNNRNGRHWSQERDSFIRSNSAWIAVLDGPKKALDLTEKAPADADKPIRVKQGTSDLNPFVCSEPFLLAFHRCRHRETPGKISRQGLSGPGCISSHICLSMVDPYIAGKL